MVILCLRLSPNSRCYVNHVGLIFTTNRQLLQGISEDTSSNSSMGKHMKQHGVKKPTVTDNFLFLKKCANKFECLVYETIFIQELKSSLKVQSDSIRAKLFY